MDTRGGSRTAATSKMERFLIIVNDWKPLPIITIIVNDWKPLPIITRRSILDVAAVLDPPLGTSYLPILWNVLYLLIHYLPQNGHYATLDFKEVEII